MWRGWHFVQLQKTDVMTLLVENELLCWRHVPSLHHQSHQEYAP